MSANLPAPGETNPLRINQAVRDVASGRSNAHGFFTLAVSPATSTTVKATNCGATSHVSIEGRNAAGATEKATGGCFVSSTSAGSFVVTHSSSAAVRNFSYAFSG